MESEGVSLPLIHEHLMVPWNHLGKGDCCEGFEAITDGYFCEICNFFIHKKCIEPAEYIQHPSHPSHTLQLHNKFRDKENKHCKLCGKLSMFLSYHCEICDFDMHLHCAKHPPPDVIEIPETHRHKLTLRKKRVKIDCEANCKGGGGGFSYNCHECYSSFHLNCIWNSQDFKQPIEYTTIDAGDRVSLPWIHKHFLIPCNDPRKGDCCGRYEAISDGYYCKRCDFFVHKKCGGEAPESIQHPSHSIHPLWLQFTSDTSCDLCGKNIVDLSYSCKICEFNIDIYCVKYPPPEFIDISEKHHHELTLLKHRTTVRCHAKCGKTNNRGFPYKCDKCYLSFHVDCIWRPLEVKHALEVNHLYHHWHPLKLLISQPPEYSDRTCRLCGRKIDDRLFYHCSSCNFTLDMRCVLHPPPNSLLDLKAHDHQLTLLPRLDSFTCNACGLKGDRSQYACLQCGFMIHQDCLELPRVININRHDHRVSRTSVLGIVNSLCKVCHKKVDWTFGGYSCQRFPNYVVHSKCATREDVWNGKELEGVPEEIEDIEPYVVIDENTIQHFSHKEHYLRLHANGILFEERKWCRACSHPIGLHSFYGCMDCDFSLHKNCAECLRKKWHAVHNDRLTLVTSEANKFGCSACKRISNGFMYAHGEVNLDVRCASISEPFVHPSHPQNSLYYTLQENDERCSGCNKKEGHMLKCIEDGCELVLGFKCATLPQVVKHRVDDHPLSLCYGDKKTSAKYWCDICEEETNSKTWFYTCKDYRASLHTKCVLGDFAGFMPRSTLKYVISFEVVPNDSVSRPVCESCNLRCMYPIIVKTLGTSDVYCSPKCMFQSMEYELMVKVFG